uniref:Uncharacterized protein n=1 Tax=Oryza punctata TaxID=4537 RepID=A0A0E0JPE4_ORYPU
MGNGSGARRVRITGRRKAVKMRMGPPAVRLPRTPRKTPRSKSAMRDAGTKRLSHGCGTSHIPLPRSFSSALCTRSRKSTYGRSVVNTVPGMKSSSPSSASTSLKK